MLFGGHRAREKDLGGLLADLVKQPGDQAFHGAKGRQFRMPCLIHVESTVYFDLQRVPTDAWPPIALGREAARVRLIAPDPNAGPLRGKACAPCRTNRLNVGNHLR